MSIGIQLKEFRKGKGLTLHQAEEQSGVKAQQISNMENGRYNITIYAANKYLEKFGYELDTRIKKLENR